MNRTIKFYSAEELEDVKTLVRGLVKAQNNGEKNVLYKAYLDKYPHRNSVSLSVKITAIKRELGFLPPKEGEKKEKEVEVKVVPGIPVRKNAQNLQISKNVVRFPFKDISIDMLNKQLVVNF